MSWWCGLSATEFDAEVKRRIRERLFKYMRLRTDGHGNASEHGVYVKGDVDHDRAILRRPRRTNTARFDTVRSE